MFSINKLIHGQINRTNKNKYLKKNCKKKWDIKSILGGMQYISFWCYYMYYPVLIQSLKRSTFQFWRSFSVCSSSFYRTFIVHSLRSAFTVAIHSAFAQRAFIDRSQSVHRSLSIQSSLSFGI